MKTMILFTVLLSSTAFAEVTLQDCQDDAQFYGHHKSPLKPLAECESLVKNDPVAVSVTSADNRYRAFGAGNMIYLETFNESAVVTERILLAGDQTELVNVKQLFIDVPQKRLIVVQLKGSQYELMVHDLEFIGNVSPLKVMRSEIFSGVTSVKFDSAEELEVKNASGTFTLNADGESREELSTKKALSISEK